MANFKIHDPGNRTGPELGNRVQTVDSTISLLKELTTQTEFYELEPLEVLEVHLDESKSSFPKTGDGNPDYSFVGAIIGRFILSEQGKNIDNCKTFKPLNPSVSTTPIVGEVVIGVKYLGDYYYTSQLNLFGNPNLNTWFGVSKQKHKDTLVTKKDITTPNEQDDTKTIKGYYFNDYGVDTDARKILPNEGDVIVEGRFGNTIRLGSDIKNENQDSPNIILNVGQTKEGEEKSPIKENIDNDGSSIYLTTNQELEFKPSVESKLVSGPYKGKNILLSSDRIIFNTKNEGDIGLFSSRNFSLGAVKELVIESPVTKIGSVQATEPIVLGNQLVKVLNKLIQVLQSGLLSPVGPVAPNPAGAAFIGEVKGIMNSTLNSKNNKVE
tara:strand:- start:4960 stop:6105 length:1146 start_codon:yes stop_codon:yes gene_type:complete